MKKKLMCNIRTFTELYLALTLNIKKLLGRFIKKIINKKKLKKKLKRNFFNLRDKFYLLKKKFYISYTTKRYFYLFTDHIVLHNRVNCVLIIYFRLLSIVYATRDNPAAQLLWNLMLKCYWDELSLTCFNDLLWEYPNNIHIDWEKYLYINPNNNNNNFIKKIIKRNNNNNNNNNNINNNNINNNINNNNNKITSMLPPGNWSRDLPTPEMLKFGKKPSGVYSSGFFPTPHAVDTRREYDKFPFDMDKHRRRKLANGSRYKFLWVSEDKKKIKWVYPESYHYNPLYMSFFTDTLRIYDDANIRYVYHTHAYHMGDRFCKITYPDGTHLVIYNKKVVLEHIKYHHKHIFMNYKQESHYFFYDKWYKAHFEPFRKANINLFFSKEKPSFKRKSITINELLNPVILNNNSSIKKIGVNDLLNKDSNSSNLNTKKIGINDLLNKDSKSNNSSNLNTKKIGINDLLNIDNDNSNLNTNQTTINNLSDKDKGKDKVVDKKSWKYFVENSKKKINPLFCVKTKKGWVDLSAIDWSDDSPKNRVLKKLYYERIR